GAQLGGKFSPEVALKLARDAFAEPQPAEPPIPSVMALWSLTTKLSQSSGNTAQPGAPDITAQLLQGPVSYVWRALLDQTSQAIQKSWQDTIVTPLSTSVLPTADKFTSFYGPGGKFPHFTEQFLQPFLSKEDLRPKTLLSFSLPLSPDFLQLVKDGQ